MGFSQVYLVGCDTTREGYAYDKSLVRDERPDSVQRACLTASRVMGENGIYLGDCTQGGTLDLPKHDINELLN